MTLFEAKLLIMSTGELIHTIESLEEIYYSDPEIGVTREILKMIKLAQTELAGRTENEI